jgi:hypothetical protein
MIIPIKMSALPGIAVGGVFSPSIMNANVPANSGIRSEIDAVTTGGKRFDAKANAKLGIAVHNTPRPRNISRLLPLSAFEESVFAMKHCAPVNTTLPKAKVMKVTLEGSGAAPFFAKWR